MPKYYSHGDEPLSITLISFSLLLCAGQPAFSSIRTETSEWPCGSLYDAMSIINTNTTLYRSSYKGMILHQQHWCVNSSGMLLLFITYFQLLSPSYVLSRRSVRLHMNFIHTGLSFSEKRNAERITERRGWNRLVEGQKFINCCMWIAVRWWNSAPRVALTCIHKMCHHSCPGTPRLGEGPLFLSLLTKWREDMSDFRTRPQPIKINVCPACYADWIHQHFFWKKEFNYIIYQISKYTSNFIKKSSFMLCKTLHIKIYIFFFV